MIKVRDFKNYLPELFTCYPTQCILDNKDFDVEIYVNWWDTTDLKPGNWPTILVNQEPTFNLNIVEKITQIRPCTILASINQTHNSIYFNPWILTTARANQYIKQTLSNKTYYASALLGGWSPDRQQILEYLTHYKLLDRCLVNIQPRQQKFAIGEDNAQYYQSPDIATLDLEIFTNTVYKSNEIFTMVPISSDSQWLFVSQLIPEKIYNLCEFNIIAETQTINNDVFLITEKIAKSLIFGSPFVVYGCCYYLKQLKTLGFKTFSCWIDEGYDDIVNPTARIKSMIGSLAEFFSLPVDVRREQLEQMQSVCEHNRQLALNSKHWIDPIFNCIHKYKST